LSFRVEKLKCLLRDHVLPGFLFGWRAALNKVPDANCYSPTFKPWRKAGIFRLLCDEISSRTLLSPDRVWVLYCMARQALNMEGDFLEAGVYQGGTARVLRQVLASKPRSSKRLHLFDSFAGMPKTNSTKDIHRENDFCDTTVESVSAFVGKDDFVVYHKGFMPDTFVGLEDAQFSFAHVDVDIYQSVLDSCAFVYPKMKKGGIILFDDYGLPSCPGAREAVDTFFADKPEIPLVLNSGQAIVFVIAS
jgi:O-methyltransferase